ncbi:MAG: Gfo/Idh/MocA family oxidoreductase [Endomicrobiales bacterium]|nr:Gfo/Idh/MocA family oxidoreductase [Endomicrobiales bacterium]
MNKIKTAVIGVGSLGQHHARILASHPQSMLSALVDTDLKRLEKISNKLKIEEFITYKDIIGKVEAAVIAVPTPMHYQIAKDLLEAGIHCLVEKPFTTAVKEAEELISLSMAKKTVLQVGHIERFNPAVIAAMPYINNPKFIEVNRLGPYDPRTSHIGVILDLMIHDLDILLSLVQDKVIGVEAHGAKILSDHEDIVKARIKFEKGCVADVSASRVSLEKYRKIRIFQPDSYISVDYAGKNLKIYQKKENVKVVKGLGDIKVLKPKLKNEEQLYKELDHFLQCVSEGKKAVVSGEHGRDALELALEILKNIKL